MKNPPRLAFSCAFIGSPRDADPQKTSRHLPGKPVTGLDYLRRENLSQFCKIAMAIAFLPDTRSTQTDPNHGPAKSSEFSIGRSSCGSPPMRKGWSDWINDVRYFDRELIRRI